MYFKCDDLFQHFAELESAGTLPTFAELDAAARVLHRAYSNTRALYFAMEDVNEPSTWSSTVPQGTAWSASAQSSDASNKNESEFQGDLLLARSIAFMRDALVSREAAYAVAEGDVGRLYEMIKVCYILLASRNELITLAHLQLMLFTFAGSSHSKYVTYLLETITTLELEASAELRDAILRSMLVNIDGHSGTFCALDFMQEYFNRLLEAIVQRKGIDYGAPYIRTVIARNLHHLGQIKKGFREGFGLQPRSGHHNAPHTRPEVRILLDVYRHHELHSRRAGRRLDAKDLPGENLDDFGRGIEHLRKTRLATWVKATTASRLTMQSPTCQANGQCEDEEPVEEPEVEGSHPVMHPALGMMCVNDGRLLIKENINNFDLDDETDADVDPSWQ